MAVDLAALFVCFFTPAFLLAVVFVVELEVAGAGEVCAKRDTPASAMVIVIPIIAFFIVFFSFWKRMFCPLLSIKTKAIMNRG